jgi:hypothetical protein
MPLNENMLTIMSSDAMKESRLTITILLKDGSTRKGDYLEIVKNPLKQPSFKGVRFIKILSTEKPHQDVMYIPITEITGVTWAL